jgi:hypothetical protein
MFKTEGILSSVFKRQMRLDYPALTALKHLIGGSLPFGPTKQLAGVACIIAVPLAGINTLSRNAFVSFLEATPALLDLLRRSASHQASLSLSRPTSAIARCLRRNRRRSCNGSLDSDSDTEPIQSGRRPIRSIPSFKMLNLFRVLGMAVSGGMAGDAKMKLADKASLR